MAPTQKRADENGNIEWKCPKCSRKLGSQGSLIWHRRVVHGPPRYTCEPCGKSWRENRYYRTHMDKHEGIRYPCDCCTPARHFASPRTLKKHQRILARAAAARPPKAKRKLDFEGVK